MPLFFAANDVCADVAVRCAATAAKEHVAAHPAREKQLARTSRAQAHGAADEKRLR